MHFISTATYPTAIGFLVLLVPKMHLIRDVVGMGQLSRKLRGIPDYWKEMWDLGQFLENYYQHMLLVWVRKKPRMPSSR